MYGIIYQNVTKEGIEGWSIISINLLLEIRGIYILLNNY